MFAIFGSRALTLSVRLKLIVVNPIIASGSLLYQACNLIPLWYHSLPCSSFTFYFLSLARCSVVFLSLLFFFTALCLCWGRQLLSCMCTYSVHMLVFCVSILTCLSTCRCLAYCVMITWCVCIRVCMCVCVCVWGNTLWVVGEPPFSRPRSTEHCHSRAACHAPFDIHSYICMMTAKSLIHNGRVLFKQLSLASHQVSTTFTRCRPVSFSSFNFTTRWLPRNR